MPLQPLAFTFVHNHIVVQRYEKNLRNLVRYVLKRSFENSRKPFLKTNHAYFSSGPAEIFQWIKLFTTADFSEGLGVKEHYSFTSAYVPAITGN